MSKINSDSEKRYFQIEFREDEQSGRKVAGYAAIFNSRSEDMGFIEIIEPGAFRDAIQNSDVRALFNHDPNQVLARTASGTLKIEEDEKGLRYEFDLPDTTYARDLAEMMRRGDVNQSSFAFTVSDQEWIAEESSDGKKKYTRKIKKVKRLYDVSPVTYPAYPDTEVALQSIPGFPEEEAKEETRATADPYRDRLNAALMRGRC